MHVDMWWIGPIWPKHAFGDQKGLIRKKDMPFGDSPDHAKMFANFSKNRFIIFSFLSEEAGFGSKSGVLGCFWPGCEVADLKQRQVITLDHRNKIQSFVLPAVDPGKAPNCITEYGHCTCEHGHICHTAPTAQKYGFFLTNTQAALPGRGWDRKVAYQPRNMTTSAEIAKVSPVGPKRGAKKQICFLRKFAIFVP